MKRPVLRAVVALLLALSCAGCNLLGGEEEKEKGSREVGSQDDANTVAMIIRRQVTDPCEVYSPTTWNYEQVEGYAGGYAVVHGSYTEDSGAYYDSSSESYNDVVMSYESYSSDEDFPAITGSATMNGTLTTDSSFTRGNTYSGGWIIQGQVTMEEGTAGDDVYDFKGEVTFAIRIVNFDYAGVIAVDGTEWDVTSDY